MQFRACMCWCWSITSEEPSAWPVGRMHTRSQGLKHTFASLASAAGEPWSHCILHDWSTIIFLQLPWWKRNMTLKRHRTAPSLRIWAAGKHWHSWAVGNKTMTCQYSMRKIGYIWIINTYHTRRSITPYFVSHKHSREEVSIEFHWCSMCLFRSQITACNWFPNSIQSFLIISLMTLLIFVAIFR